MAQQLQDGVLSPSDLPLLQIVLHQGKLYSRNNRRLYVYKVSEVQLVQARITLADDHFFQGFDTRTSTSSLKVCPVRTVEV